MSKEIELMTDPEEIQIKLQLLRKNADFTKDFLPSIHEHVVQVISFLESKLLSAAA
jgi:hypothetical protein